MKGKRSEDKWKMERQEVQNLQTQCDEAVAVFVVFLEDIRLLARESISRFVLMTLTHPFRLMCFLLPIYHVALYSAFCPSSDH